MSLLGTFTFGLVAPGAVGVIGSVLAVDQNLSFGQGFFTEGE